MADTEKDSVASGFLKFFVGMIRDGFQVEDSNGEIVLTARGPDGLRTTIITQADLDNGRVPEIIKEMLASPY